MTSEKSEEAKEKSIQEIYGPLIGGKDLIAALGFKTNAAFRRAVRLSMLQIDTFQIEGRRGRFAFSKEVDDWLLALKHR